MKNLATVLVTTVSFLSAGAFAGNPLPVQPQKTNMTVVYKNQISSTKVEITDRICKLNFCQEA